MPRSIVVLAAALRLLICGVGPCVFVPVTRAHPPMTISHVGMASASAVVAVDDLHFLAASDEDNRIRLYSTAGGPSLTELDVSPWLHLNGRRGEVDLEGAATLQGVTYWLGSHGRAKDGRSRPDRERLFGTRIVTNGNLAIAAGRRIQFYGLPYRGLLGDFLQAPALEKFQLRVAESKAPGEGGINLEGLAAGPNGELLVGFRSPVPEGRALLVPLLNPAELLQGRPARIGEPISLDLGGLGVRDLAWSGREWFFIAGRMNGGGTARLFRWPGLGSPPERVEHSGLKHLNPEALTVFGEANRPRLLVLSDYGNRSESEFRSIWLEPSAPGAPSVTDPRN